MNRIPAHLQYRDVDGNAPRADEYLARCARVECRSPLVMYLHNLVGAPAVFLRCPFGHTAEWHPVLATEDA
jgi:hypothetical protein